MTQKQADEIVKAIQEVGRAVLILDRRVNLIEADMKAVASALERAETLVHRHGLLAEGDSS